MIAWERGPIDGKGRRATIKSTTSTHGSLFSDTEAFCDRSAPAGGGGGGGGGNHHCLGELARFAMSAIRYLAVDDIRSVLEG